MAEPYIEFFSTSDRTSAPIPLTGLPASRDLRVVQVARGTWLRSERSAPPVSGSSFPSQSYHAQPFYWSSNTARVLAHFSARAPSGAPVSLRVVDLQGRVHCAAEASSGAAVCTATVAHADFPVSGTTRKTDLIVEAENRGTHYTSVVVEGFFENAAAGTPTEFEVDPVVNPDGSAMARVPINLRTFAPRNSEGMILEVRDGTSPLRRITTKTSWNGSVPGASLVFLDDVAAYSPGERSLARTSNYGIESHRRMPFLIPANVDTVDITVSSISHPNGSTHRQGTPHDVVMELHHVPIEPETATVAALAPGRSPDIVVDAQPFELLPVAARESFRLTGAQLKPGRWYVVPVSKLGIPLNFSVTVEFPQGRPLAPAFGHYFNPSRPGHGFYLGEAGNDWVLIWYTYEGSGTPIWYYAQGPKPSAHIAGSQWNADLYRNVWTDGGTRFQYVGWVQLAVTGEGVIDFAHLVHGNLGMQRMQRLGAPGCSTRFGDQPLDVNGLWFSPERSGYGFSVEVIGGTEFYLSYAYDGLGRPRWATAQQAFGASDSPPLLQAQGFCSLCAVRSVERRTIGTLQRTLTTSAEPDGRAGFSRLGLDAQWTNGLPGAWRANLPASMLSARTDCR